MPIVVIAHTKQEEAATELAVLGQRDDIEVVFHPRLDTPEAKAALAVCDALTVGLHDVTDAMLAEMPNCKIVVRVGTGYDAIDFEAAAKRGVWVTNVPDYSIDEVSTHALSLLLALERNLKGHLGVIAQGNWGYLSASPIRRLRGQTLGVLGYGRIGSEMGRKGQGIGLRVIAHDPVVSPERIRELGAEPVDFETLMRESDFLSLHVPLNDSTRRIINARALSLMKPTAYLINTARGDIVDIDALVDAVRAGTIAGAGIDVLPVEPPPVDSPVLHEPNIIITPHIGWASVEAGIDSRQRGAEDVLRVLRGERPRTPVNEVPRTESREPSGIAD
jgi:D-3-phosphoglycerate dehydrogenase